MSSKKKHIILILVLIALISFRYMTVRNHRVEKSRITILPETHWEDLSSVQEGIRDYAYDHQIKLDVWYKKQMSEKSFAELVKEERIEAWDSSGISGILSEKKSEWLQI